MRIVPRPALKGSQYWLQIVVNHHPELLDHPAIGRVCWKSPLVDDDYAEYRDRLFLKKIGRVDLAGELAKFWPARGPQWDALGVSEGGVVLVEAKSHLREMMSPPTAAGPASLARIDAAFATVRGGLGVTGDAAWTRIYYQLANRIAHLSFLRSRGVEAHLLLVGFLNDHAMGGPKTAAQWSEAYEAAGRALGLAPEHPLAAFIHHIHPDVEAIRAPAVS